MAEERRSFTIKEDENGGVHITDEVLAGMPDWRLPRWRVWIPSPVISHRISSARWESTSSLRVSALLPRRTAP